MPLQGSLKEMSLANLIQVNCQEMRSARLTLQDRGRTGEVYFSDGQVVHASAGKRAGADAVYELLVWETGTFTLETEVHAPEKTITVPWTELLLEGMKRVADHQTEKRPMEGPMSSNKLAQLRAIEGVTGAVIAASDGVVLAADVPDGDGEKEAAVAVFVGSAAGQIGEALCLGTFARGTVTLKNKRVLILQQPDRYIGLWLAENASPAIVGSAAAHVLQ